MADNEIPPVPLKFSASFPCDARYRPAVAELAVKVAKSLGYPDDEAGDVGQAIERAFADATQREPGQGDILVNVTLRAPGDAIEATVRCPHGTLIDLSRPRTH